ncbi:translation initiation factor eif-2B alpha subunit, putative [Entamoeba dispar SAW760]|uniref:Translation initiation factor eIF2B subunit alpha n=1 Tax=Entamoeba dispar (strain ATCC PRA-260 / SAW760) TaxID=370354 RepID=B0ED29_ENTDS|nr:translation initiation factor eif-2B alpha subunit, putative [Entamoeba dispar SAW760]EDR27446.1 translation initiation factor eif-2B alpha subunit, putative [Entamoeba dispar SAW760]|eukprot:EDR27446.1 translation initiation factor eif-2B alpha subunit, putative [Entamoeba dispar SAW760]
MNKVGEPQLILDAVNHMKQLMNDKILPGIALCAVDTLNFVLDNTKATVHHELSDELRGTITHLIKAYPSSLTLKCSCDLYMHFINQTTLANDFSVVLSNIRHSGRVLQNRLHQCRDKIVDNCASFIRPSITILTHGLSMVVCGILLSHKDTQFKLIVTEGRPYNYGEEVINYLKENGAKFEIELICDTAVAYKMKEVDFVLIGSQVLVKTGGSVNSVGTYNIAIIAKHFNVPVYVAVECFKFSDSYPIEQEDVNLTLIDNPTKKILYDYTPPEMISLIFSDLSVFTPSAVADELIKLYGG